MNRFPISGDQTHIDRFFLTRSKKIVDMEKALEQCAGSRDLLYQAKRKLDSPIKRLPDSGI